MHPTTKPGEMKPPGEVIASNNLYITSPLSGPSWELRIVITSDGAGDDYE